VFEVEAWGRVASSIIKANLLVINEMRQYLQVNAEGPITIELPPSDSGNAMAMFLWTGYSPSRNGSKMISAPPILTVTGVLMGFDGG
jgi:hypothetical protein